MTRKINFPEFQQGEGREVWLVLAFFYHKIFFAEFFISPVWVGVGFHNEGPSASARFG